MGSYAIREKQSLYFLTSTIVGWVDIFTRKQYRDLIIDSFKYCIDSKGLTVYAYVIMSNHIHWIASAQWETGLDCVVRDLKKYTSKKLVSTIADNEKESRKEWMLNLFNYAGKTHNDNKDYKVWQSGNHPEALFTDKFIEQKLQYIHYNPVRAGWVEKPEDYLCSSAESPVALI